MPRVIPTHGLLALALVVLAPAAAALAQAPDLHVVLVADTDDTGIGESCHKDFTTIQNLFDVQRPPARQTKISVVAGKTRTFTGGTFTGPDNFTQKHLRKLLADLPLGPHTGVLVYFCGHGDYTPRDGHRMVIPPGGGGGSDRFPNEDVFRAIAARNQPVRMLAVVADSCCPNKEEEARRRSAKRAVTGPKSKSGGGVPQVLDDLFYKPGGSGPAVLIDVNGSAEEQLAWGTGADGGFFTNGFTKAIRANGATLYEDDKNGDGLLSWHEFMPRVIAETEGLFDRTAAAQAGAGDPLLGPDGRAQKKQTPQAFRLPDPPANHRFGYKLGLSIGPNAGGGVLVARVAAGGPSAAAGLAPGDVVREVGVAVNGSDYRRTVRGSADWVGTIDLLPAGVRTLELKVDRGGQSVTLSVTPTRN